MIDTAKAAQALVKNKIPENYAILGPLTLKKIYPLDVIDSNLQDLENNLTTFLLVSR